MRKIRNYRGFDFYTHEHTAYEDKAVEWLEANGFTWIAYGQPSQTIFRATKEGTTDDLYIPRTCGHDAQYEALLRLFVRSWEFTKHFENAQKKMEGMNHE